MARLKNINKPWASNLLMFVVPFVVLLAVELLSFLPGLFRVGFYLDDWTKISHLHFTSRNFWDLVVTGISDPTEMPRLLQPFYYACTYLWFGDKPLGYHLLACACEIAGAYAFYLTVRLLAENNFLALAAALIFLINPSHDATHYWVGGTLVSLGCTLFIFSWWLAIRSVKLGSGFSYWLSVAFFTASLLCYEAFLPLLGLIVLSDWMLYRKKGNAILPVVRMLPYIFMMGITVVYQRILLPHLAPAFLPPVQLSAGHFWEVMLKGFDVSLGPGFWQFCFQQAMVRVDRLVFSLPLSVHLILITVLVVFGLVAVSFRQVESSYWKRLMVLGLVSIVLTYAIFGFSWDYMPTLTTMVNRINLGATLGVSLLISGLCGGLIFWLGRNYRIAAVSLLLFLVFLFVTDDWYMAFPWCMSWEVQKGIQRELVRHREEIYDDDCVILANAPRYVQWAPVFDGMWDFQPMMCLTLNNQLIKGNVVSERLEVDQHNVKDISSGYLCGTYDFKDLKLFIANPQYLKKSQLIEVETPQRFISLVEQYGMQFGLEKNTIKRWKSELANSI